MAEKTEDPALAKSAAGSSSDPTSSSGSKLLSKGFVSLLATQFFGAANDNILKQCLTFMVATGIWSGAFGKDGLGEGGQVVPALFLTLPFILLSGYAGQISDKYSKQKVMLWVKIAEIPIAIVAFIGFYTHNLWLTLFAMLLLSVQSSFFGPAKYGVIPEIAEDEHLSMANGVINMLTNLAVIAGSLIAGPLSDLYNPQPPPIPAIACTVDGMEKPQMLDVVVNDEELDPETRAMTGSLMKADAPPVNIASLLVDANGDGVEETVPLGAATSLTLESGELLGEITVEQNGNYEFVPDVGYLGLANTPVPWAPGAGLLVVAALGLLSIVMFPRIPAANPSLKFDLNPFKTYFESIAVMAKGPLLAVVLAWAAFYMIAMIALLILPEYQKILNVSFTETSYLLGILGVGIGVGSVATGWISGKEIRPWLIPFGAGGMCVSFLLLGLLEPNYMLVAALILFSGFFAGFYIVPLQALIQILSPDDERGRIIGTSGAISFCFSSLGPIVFWIASNRLGMPANRIFLICAAMAIVGTIYGVIQLKKIMAYREAQQASGS